MVLLELMTEHPTVRLFIEYVTVIVGLNVVIFFLQKIQARKISLSQYCLIKIDEKQRFLQMVTATEQRISFFQQKTGNFFSNGSSLLSKTACATYF